MSTAQRALRCISQLARDQHRRYAEALRDSMTWDRENNAKPPSPNDLVRWHELPLEALQAQMIVLTKSQAAALLQDVGHPTGLPSLRRNVLTDSRYFKKLNRKVAKVKGRLVFTYTEVLALSGFTGTIRPPDEIERYLR